MTGPTFWASDGEQYAGFWSRLGAQIPGCVDLSPICGGSRAGVSIENDRDVLISTFAPRWYRYMGLLAGLWSWSELAVMLTNPERRALHDFIAGTIVIKQEYVPPAEGAPLPSSATV
jgi:hypothetical protein